MPLHSDQRWTVEHAPRLGYYVIHDDGSEAEFDANRQFTADIEEAQALAQKLNAKSDKV